MLSDFVEDAIFPATTLVRGVRKIFRRQIRALDFYRFLLVQAKTHLRTAVSLLQDSISGRLRRSRDFIERGATSFGNFHDSL